MAAGVRPGRWTFVFLLEEPAGAEGVGRSGSLVRERPQTDRGTDGVEALPDRASRLLRKAPLPLAETSVARDQVRKVSAEDRLESGPRGAEEAGGIGDRVCRARGLGRPEQGAEIIRRVVDPRQDRHDEETDLDAG